MRSPLPSDGWKRLICPIICMEQILSCHRGSSRFVALNWVMVSPGATSERGRLAARRHATLRSSSEPSAGDEGCMARRGAARRA